MTVLAWTMSTALTAAILGAIWWAVGEWREMEREEGEVDDAVEAEREVVERLWAQDVYRLEEILRAKDAEIARLRGALEKADRALFRGISACANLWGDDTPPPIRRQAQNAVSVMREALDAPR